MWNSPALQKTFVDVFFEFACGFGTEEWRGFLEFAVVSVSQGNEARKVLNEFRENSEQNSVRHLGQKFEKCRSAMFLT